MELSLLELSIGNQKCDSADDDAAAEVIIPMCHSRRHKKRGGNYISLTTLHNYIILHFVKETRHLMNPDNNFESHKTTFMPDAFYRIQL